MNRMYRKVKDAVDWDNYPYPTKEVFYVWKNEKKVKQFDNKKDAISFAEDMEQNADDLIEVEKVKLYGKYKKDYGIDGSDSECIYTTDYEYSSHGGWKMNISDSRRIKDDQYSDELVSAFKDFLEEESGDYFHNQETTMDYSGATKRWWFSQSEPIDYFIHTGYGTGSEKIDEDIQNVYGESIEWAAKQNGISVDEFYDLNEDDNEQYNLKEKIWEDSDSYLSDLWVSLDVYVESVNNKIRVQAYIGSDVSKEDDLVYEGEGSSMEDLKRIAKDVAELSIEAK